MSDYRKDIRHTAIAHKVGEHVAPDGCAYIVYETICSVETCTYQTWDEAAPSVEKVWAHALKVARDKDERADAVAMFGIAAGPHETIIRVTRTQIIGRKKYRRQAGAFSGSSPVGRIGDRFSGNHHDLSAEVVAAVEARAGGRDVVDFIAEGLKASKDVPGTWECDGCGRMVDGPHMNGSRGCGS